MIVKFRPSNSLNIILPVNKTTTVGSKKKEKSAANSPTKSKSSGSSN